MKIPKNAKKVFTGEIFDVYQWPQKMFDGSVATFEALKRPNTVEIICTQGDKVLISKEEQPTKAPGYTLLGGRVDKTDKSPLAAAKRELLEEGGLKSKDWKLIKTWEPNPKIDYKIHFFVARECKKVSDQKLNPGEKIEVKKINFNKFVEIATNENFWGRELREELLRRKLNKTLGEFKKIIFGN